MSKAIDVVRLKPYQYVHILDNNSNVTRVMVGPCTYTRLDHEVVLQAPQSCVCVSRELYCVIENPVARDPAGNLVCFANGQVKVRLGDTEVRLYQEPFPLYPGEVLQTDVTTLPILTPLQAMLLKATRSFDDGTVQRKAGDEWQLQGPCTYTPRVEVEVISTIDAITIQAQNQAVRVRARFNFDDRNGTRRRAGEEWLYDRPGAFIPSVEEEVVEVITASVLTSTKAIHVEATNGFTDRFGRKRAAGEKWLVTCKETSSFIPTPNERVSSSVNLTTVGARQWCIVLNPVDATGVAQLGARELRKGLRSFFLHPGEALEGGKINDIYVLGDDEALLMCARERFVEPDKTVREPGNKWLIRGPRDYIPSTQVVVEERRKAIPLDSNEGVYIRNRTTGAVRAHVGSTIMLSEEEELWEKPLDPLVEELLSLPRLTKTVKDPSAALAARQKHKVVACNVPHSALVQVYDYKRKRARVVMGPDLVMLGPDEEFTMLSLSGGKPKQGDAIKTLCLNLGPDFMTDIIVIETSDHARLQLQLSYNWEFNRNLPDIQERAFSVPDFVGDACKAIASRIRGFVASESFDSFHRNSSTLIQLAVFGADQEGVRPVFDFPSNGLIVTAVDIHSVDPVDPKTREALVKSVQLAIEITTKSQEALARHKATELQQEAQGKLERQVIEDQALAEAERKKLLSGEAVNAAIESTGSSKAQSKAEAESKLIEGQTEVELAQKRSKAGQTSFDAELAILKLKQDLELGHKTSLCDLQIHKTRELGRIEAAKFGKMIAAVGKDTIKALARAGPELQARLLQGLGLQGYLVTDGSNPINLFNTAKGMTAMPAARKTA